MEFGREIPVQIFYLAPRILTLIRTNIVEQLLPTDALRTILPLKLHTVYLVIATSSDGKEPSGLFRTVVPTGEGAPHVPEAARGSVRRGANFIKSSIDS